MRFVRGVGDRRSGHTLWLNTLYTELAAHLGAYLAVSGLVLGVAGSGRGQGGPMLMVTGMTALGFSRLPHLLLPLVLAVLALWLLPRARTPVGLALLILATGIALVQGLRPVPGGFALVNRTNVVLPTVLQAAPDPQRLLSRIGLPAACADLVHLSIYKPGGRDVERDCPGLADYSRSELVLAVLREPVLLVRLVSNSLHQSTA